MTIFINFDINAICKKILQEQLDKLDLKYSIKNLGEVDLKDPISEEKIEQLNDLLKNCNIEIVENKKSIMIQQIKDAIVEMVFMEEKLPLKTSSYLSDKLKLNYTYISNLFSSVTYTSIESFIIMQKTERAKQLLNTNELNISEISYNLNYCSPAHFCGQFKKITGLTPTAFQRIMNKRRELN